MDAWLPLTLILTLVSLGAGFVQSFLGFGYAVVSLAVLPFFVEIRLANLVISLTIIAPLTMAVMTYRSELNWRLLRFSLAGALLGLPVGLVVFAQVDADWLVRGTGIVILLLTADGLFRPLRDGDDVEHGPWWSVLAGASSGFLAGSVGVAGPPIAAYAARQPWRPQQFKAFVVSFSLMLAVAKAASVAVAGWLGSRVLLLTAASIPFAIVGGRLGAILSARMATRHFRRLAFIVLASMAVGMILRGSPPPSDDMLDDTARNAPESSRAAQSAPQSAPMSQQTGA